MAKKKKPTVKQTTKVESAQALKVEVSAKEETFRIVGIGASAGGLEAFEQFFSNMPSDKGIAFVIVQHLDPTGHSSMPQILSRFTKMPIEVAKDGMRVELNSIYLLPPNKNMGIEDGALYLQEPTRPPGLRLPIDFFFRSLAKEMGADAICIILSGTGTDGTLGLRAIKAELGTVFVQDPDSARYDGMPRSAVDTGLADFVLKPSEMPEKLIQFVEHSIVNGAKFGAAVEKAVEPLKQIFAILRTRTGHDFSRYKQTTIRRRLQRRMSVNQISNVAEYARFLKDNEDEVKALLKDLLISVTNFFRDPEAFETLKRQMKELIKSRAQASDLRVWVAGCATGEEAYSVAMIIQECLDELEKHLQIQMYGTDIDVDALHIARAGKYPGNIAADVTPDRLRRFFIKENDAYRVRKEVRESIVFAPQNFIKDPPFSKMDLICCRNLLIYLESDVQKRLLPLLHYALKPGGILFLGPSETAGESADLFNLVERKWKIYQHREAVVSAERLKFPAAFAPGTRADVGEAVQEVSKPKIPELTEKIFLDSYAPTFAVIDEKYRLVYVRGRTGRYLEIASGQPNWTILDMAREGLKPELTSAVYRAISEKRKIVRDGIQVKTNGEFQTINLTVAPLTEPNVPPGLLMIVFQEVSPTLREAKIKPSVKSRKRVVELEDELKLTKENLQTTIEELEATNEELKSANEELQSNNEELQSTNEELDTSREELQSLNEELTTLNAELQDKNELLAKANDDLKNFLNRTDIAIIFLDEELKIRSYTPATSDVFNVRDIDVGRPLSEITSRLAYDGVVTDAQEVLRTLHPKEMEVQRKDEAWYKMRIMPYLTAQNVVSGLVMSFLDIDEQKKGAEELIRLNEQLDDLAKFPQENPNPTMRVDKNGTILTANPACSKIEAFKCRQGEVLPKQYKKIIAEILSTGSPSVIDIEGKEHTFALNLVPVQKSGYVNIYGSDVTERVNAEKALRDSEERFKTIFRAAPDPYCIGDLEGNFLLVNEAFERFSGYSERELVGTNFTRIIAPEEIPKVSEILKSNVKRQANTNVELAHISKDGSRAIGLVSTLAIEIGGEPAILTIISEITERKKTEQELKESHDKLEERVKERTAEVESMSERLRALSHRLIEIQEEERGNIARELHDQIGQSLFAVKTLLERVDIANDKERQDLRSQTVSLLADLIDKVSTLSLELRPKILDDLGLREALEWYFGRFTSQTNIRVQFEPHDIEKSYGTPIDNTIYRVVQEALTNVARHAHATMVTVDLKHEKSVIKMCVEDNGIGFEPALLSPSSSGGIVGMQERINLVGGTLQVQSKPGSGTYLIIEIPYQSESGGRESQA